MFVIDSVNGTLGYVTLKSKLSALKRWLVCGSNFAAGYALWVSPTICLPCVAPCTLTSIASVIDSPSDCRYGEVNVVYVSSQMSSSVSFSLLALSSSCIGSDWPSFSRLSPF
ncbi:hypothetical protein J1N35_017940 [Gossypium stocksii]|uniref:Uncharacterized protein n=1 Tax=Gossypium stocksii TaxID=47602 RepID=A0A9D4A674_9ROSI|nr:hypothetical protein J1N35_017940 [Gossypium stocksii]